VVRLADDSDLPAVTQLRRRWALSQGGGDEPGFEDRVRDWWRDQGERRCTWVAWAGSVPVGLVNVTVYERMPRPGEQSLKWAYVGQVYVHDAHRRRGLGRTLMTEVITWAREQGMVRLVLNPSEMSVGMYRSLGFRPAAQMLRLDLDPS